MSAEGDVEQPIQWSSEFSDDETKLLIFNYRTYNNQTGTWLLRDLLYENSSYNWVEYKELHDQIQEIEEKIEELMINLENLN